MGALWKASGRPGTHFRGTGLPGGGSAEAQPEAPTGGQALRGSVTSQTCAEALSGGHMGRRDAEIAGADPSSLTPQLPLS